jgi:hypothetical protein
LENETEFDTLRRALIVATQRAKDLEDLVDKYVVLTAQMAEQMANSHAVLAHYAKKQGVH